MKMKLSHLTEKIFIEDGDPIEGAKRMVSSIQRLVGIRNMFSDTERNFSIISLIVSIIFTGSFVYVGSLSQIIYLIQVFPDKTESFKALNCISATSVPISKYIFMWTARKRLRVIFEMSRQGLSSIPAGAAQASVSDTLRKARYASYLVVTNQALSHVVYILAPFLFTLLTDDRYLPTTPGETYGLSPKYETPFYETTFILTTIATAFSAINQTGYIVLFVNLLAHELGHFYAITVTLNEVYKNLTNGPKQSHQEPEKLESEVIKANFNVRESLKFCIKHHQFLLTYHDKIRELYRVIFGAHFLMMTFVLVTTLQTMNAWDIRNTIITGITGILPLFIYCFGGELIVSAGVEMTEAVYGCGWELMEVKEARMVLLMLCITQRPLYLTAADIFVMNRETFGHVAQTVYKIYAVFN